jgi:hypothetical protein
LQQLQTGLVEDCTSPYILAILRNAIRYSRREAKNPQRSSSGHMCVMAKVKRHDEKDKIGEANQFSIQSKFINIFHPFHLVLIISYNFQLCHIKRNVLPYSEVSQKKKSHQFYKTWKQSAIAINQQHFM